MANGGLIGPVKVIGTSTTTTTSFTSSGTFQKKNCTSTINEIMVVAGGAGGGIGGGNGGNGGPGGGKDNKNEDKKDVQKPKEIEIKSNGVVPPLPNGVFIPEFPPPGYPPYLKP